LRPIVPSWRNWSNPESIVFAVLTALSLAFVVVLHLLCRIIFSRLIWFETGSTGLHNSFQSSPCYCRIVHRIPLHNLGWFCLSFHFDLSRVQHPVSSPIPWYLEFNSVLRFGKPSLAMCNARYWLICLGFIVSYGYTFLFSNGYIPPRISFFMDFCLCRAMLSKNFRAWQLFTAGIKELRKKENFSNKNLIYRSSFLIIIMASILLLWSVVNPLQASDETNSSVDLVSRTYRVVCRPSAQWPYIVVFIYFVLNDEQFRRTKC
jgi:hypothetical protein